MFNSLHDTKNVKVIMEKYYIYSLIDSSNIKSFYIGKGCGDRMFIHERNARNGNNDSNKHRYNKILKLISNQVEIKYEVLFRTDNEELAYETELTIIDEIGLENLTNIDPGGNRGYRRSASTNEKISKGRLGMKFTSEHCKNISKVRTGTKASANTKKKMSDSQMNHEVSDETKQKLSIAHKGISIESKYGKEKSDEMKEIFRKSHIGRKWVNDGKVSKQMKPYDIDEFLNENPTWKFGRPYKSRKR